MCTCYATFDRNLDYKVKWMTQTLPAVEVNIAGKVVLIVDVVIRSFSTCWKIRVKCLKARIFLFKRLFQSALHFDSLYKKQKTNV